MYTVIMTNSEEEKDFVQIWFSLDHKRKVSDRACKWSLKKWKHSDSSDSDSIALLTLLMTPIFLFSQGHKRSYGSAYDSNSVSTESQR